MKQNCWEAKKCGREQGGIKAKEAGVCPAATESSTDGLNDGINGGRSCWAIAGTLCRGQVQGVFAQKFADCRKCDFYNQVNAEQGDKLVKTSDILAILRGAPKAKK